MPTQLGDHAPRLAEARALLGPKGRHAERFLFEGPTLLAEAHASGFPMEAIFATRSAYDASALLHSLDAVADVYIISGHAAKRLSDVETPTEITVVAPRRYASLGQIMRSPGAVLVLAGLADPGNAGTLLRSAEAFGAAGVVFGSESVDPYHPKVVRAAMGSLFRLLVARASPGEVAAAAGASGRPIAGLERSAETLPLINLPQRPVLVVGQERHGLGTWASLCTQRFSIPMEAGVESLNAAVAGSLALYEVRRKTVG